MKVLAYCLFNSLVLFCSLGLAQVSPSLTTPLICKDIPVTGFSSLDIQGPVNVYIDARQSTPSLEILGDTKTVSEVTWKQKNHTLYLGTKSTYWPGHGDRLTIKVNTTPEQINKIRFHSNASLFGKGLAGSLTFIAEGQGQVNLYTNKLNLKSLHSNGRENITFHNIHSSNLSIETHNASNIKIQGEAALNTINFTGDGDLMVYWVNSPYLKINAAGKGKIILAGVAKMLDVNLTQSTQLLAKQLITQTGFIKTEKQAKAEVNVKNKLRAFAKDNSVIYYYPPIKFMSTCAQNNGLILNKRN